MTYRLLLFVHVAGVVVWVGSGFLFQMFTERAAKTEEAPTVKTIVEQGERLGKTVFGPVSLAVLATGIWLALDGGWDFDEPFVLGGLFGVASSILVGALGIGPTTKRLNAGFSAPGAGMDVVALRRLRNIGRLDLTIMTIVIFLMTVKPGT